MPVLYVVDYNHTQMLRPEVSQATPQFFHQTASDESNIKTFNQVCSETMLAYNIESIRLVVCYCIGDFVPILL